ncbi:MAG: diadenylate cyclase CdaA [Bryobacteraceae bacterium]|nr:diadenylate cyclase CdaA [Bryobacteraceae bacterium]
MNWLPAPHIPLSMHTFVVALDVLAVAVLIYQFFMIIRGRRAFHVMTGVGVLIGVYLLAEALGLRLLRTILKTLAPYTVFALIVIFQSDIRRVLARLGRRRWFAAARGLTRHEYSEEIAFTIERLSKQKIGAIIVLEKDIGLRTFVESGVPIDAVLTRDLLLSIFQKDMPLHDGAVIVQGYRIAAANCFLPLSMNPRLPSAFGTRHRAALGITEETDCLAIVVSENGPISVAEFGEIDTDLTVDQVRERMQRHFSRKKAPVTRPAPREVLSPGAPAESRPKEARR